MHPVQGFQVLGQLDPKRVAYQFSARRAQPGVGSVDLLEICTYLRTCLVCGEK